MRIWNFKTKTGATDDTKIRLPMKWGRRKGIIEDVDVVPDLFDGSLDFGTIDLLFAVMAACGNRCFLIKTAHPETSEAYFADIKERGKVAGPEYEKRIRAHFEKYKNEFREGYSLPEPPTPEMRALYDSAAQRERRPTNPCGTTLNSGFSGGEYHWRKWPLSNVVIQIRHDAR